MAKPQKADDYIGLKVNHPKFYDAENLRSEINRVFDICNGCRLCFKFCESFPIMFDKIDTKSEANRVKFLEENPEIAEEAKRKRAEMEAAGPDASKKGLEFAIAAGDERPELSAGPEDLSAGEIKEIVDHCFQCKLCYIKCPYTPSDNHEFALDFPRLLLRYKALEVREKGVPFFKKLMTNTDRLGSLASQMAGLMNWANRNPLNRAMMEKVMGVHREKLLPDFHGDTFPKWWRKKGSLAAASQSVADEQQADQPTDAASAESTSDKPPVSRKVALFSTCLVNYNSPGIGRAAVNVLRHNDVEVTWPSAQLCCGMPFCDSGDMDSALANAKKNIEAFYPLVEQGQLVITLEPSCGLMFRQEYLQLTEGGDPELHRKAKAVAAAVRDIHEYLFERKREKSLKREFEKTFGTIKYHIPCHLRAQNIGFRSRDILKLFCEDVDLIDECSAHDGTWSMDKRYFEESQRYGKKLFDRIKPEDSPKGPDVHNCDGVCTDCSLAGTQIKQGTGVESRHPVIMLAEAYGLEA